MYFLFTFNFNWVSNLLQYFFYTSDSGCSSIFVYKYGRSGHDGQKQLLRNAHSRLCLFSKGRAWGLEKLNQLEAQWVEILKEFSILCTLKCVFNATVDNSYKYLVKTYVGRFMKMRMLLQK